MFSNKSVDFVIDNDNEQEYSLLKGTTPVLFQKLLRMVRIRFRMAVAKTRVCEVLSWSPFFLPYRGRYCCVSTERTITIAVQKDWQILSRQKGRKWDMTRPGNTPWPYALHISYVFPKTFEHLWIVPPYFACTTMTARSGNTPAVVSSGHPSFNLFWCTQRTLFR